LAQPFANDGDLMQGVVKSYDPGTGQGVLLCDTDLAEYDLAANALEGSVFRMLRQGQRVVFDLDEGRRATALSLGSEIDMGTPAHPSRSAARGRAQDVG
jgi:CspA family cold shock protein